MKKIFLALLLAAPAATVLAEEWHEPRAGDVMIQQTDGGALNSRTGEYFPPAGPGGVIDTETGQFYPKAGDGFIDSNTGEYYPARVNSSFTARNRGCRAKNIKRLATLAEEEDPAASVGPGRRRAKLKATEAVAERATTRFLDYGKVPCTEDLRAGGLCRGQLDQGGHTMIIVLLFLILLVLFWPLALLVLGALGAYWIVAAVIMAVGTVVGLLEVKDIRDRLWLAYDRLPASVKNVINSGMGR